MTATAKLADVVLPATMFLEHDDIYQGGGHQHIMLGPKLLEPPGECRSNHDVIVALAQAVGRRACRFCHDRRARSSIGPCRNRAGGRWRTLSRISGSTASRTSTTCPLHRRFRYPDGKFRFKPDWQNVPAPRANACIVERGMPSLPDHWDVIEKADAKHPFRLATCPSRDYLNSSFNEMPTSRARHGPPRVKVHPERPGCSLGVARMGRVRMGNERGEIVLPLEAFPGLRPWRRDRESIAPNDQFEGGEGINTADQRLSARPLRRRRLPRQSRLAEAAPRRADRRLPAAPGLSARPGSDRAASNAPIK